jgi:pimeloyl-ACP methyl ester carboxylesterase
MNDDSLKWRQFGADQGRLAVYFHGAPGSPDEGSLFDHEAKKYDIKMICFDRFAVAPSVTGEAYYARLAAEISKVATGKPIDIIGFSIGAFVALQVIRHLPQGANRLHLVSAAAPLEAGNFLDAMAGRQVFQLARSAPVLFMMLSYWQGLLAWLFPTTLYRLLFASAAGEDRQLAATPDFRVCITKVLKSCFTSRVRGYARDIGLYVQPWQASVGDATVETHIWHGEEDNWSPPSMAIYLQGAVAGQPSIKMFSGLSHYSCLAAAVPELCKQLGTSRR